MLCADQPTTTVVTTKQNGSSNKKKQKQTAQHINKKKNKTETHKKNQRQATTINSPVQASKKNQKQNDCNSPTTILNRLIPSDRGSIHKKKSTKTSKNSLVSNYLTDVVQMVIKNELLKTLATVQSQ